MTARSGASGSQATEATRTGGRIGSRQAVSAQRPMKPPWRRVSPARYAPWNTPPHRRIDQLARSSRWRRCRGARRGTDPRGSPTAEGHLIPVAALTAMPRMWPTISPSRVEDRARGTRSRSARSRCQRPRTKALPQSSRCGAPSRRSGYRLRGRRRPGPSPGASRSTLVRRACVRGVYVSRSADVSPAGRGSTIRSGEPIGAAG